MYTRSLPEPGTVLSTVHTCSHSLLTPTLWGRHYCYPHVQSKESGSDRLSGLNQVTQPVSGKAMARTQARQRPELSPSSLIATLKACDWTDQAQETLHQPPKVQAHEHRTKVSEPQRPPTQAGLSHADHVHVGLDRFKKVFDSSAWLKICPPTFGLRTWLPATLTKGEARKMITMQWPLLTRNIIKLRTNNFTRE